MNNTTDRPLPTAANLVALERTYVRLCLCVLLATAVIKCAQAGGNARSLGARDPVFLFLETRQLLWIAAGAELFTCILVIVKPPFKRLLPILCLSLSFVTYRVGLDTLNLSYSSCPCLGSMEGAPALVMSVAHYSSLGLLSWLLFGSSAIWALGRHFLNKTPT